MVALSQTGRHKAEQPDAAATLHNVHLDDDRKRDPTSSTNLYCPPYRNLLLPASPFDVREGGEFISPILARHPRGSQSTFSNGLLLTLSFSQEVNRPHSQLHDSPAASSAASAAAANRARAAESAEDAADRPPVDADGNVIVISSQPTKRSSMRRQNAESNGGPRPSVTISENAANANNNINGGAFREEDDEEEDGKNSSVDMKGA